MRFDCQRPVVLACRYKKPANWELVSEVAASSCVPLIGNGDVLTHYEVRHLLAQRRLPALLSMMLLQSFRKMKRTP